MVAAKTPTKKQIAQFKARGMRPGEVMKPQTFTVVIGFNTADETRYEADPDRKIKESDLPADEIEGLIAGGAIKEAE
jgi:hypothetical protein